MIVVLRRGIRVSEKETVRKYLEDKGYTLREIVGEEETVLGAVGLAPVDVRNVELLEGVDRVIPISKPYKLASREIHPEDSVFDLGPVKIGGGRIVVMAGPCAVESREQIHQAAREVKQAGATVLRGGAFKPRTSPYSFQGLGEEGLQYLREAGDAVGLPVVSEVVGTDDVKTAARYLDIIQIGARNMQNFELLKRVGGQEIPVILKRGLAATVEEWLMAAEYLLAHGAETVILCERGIRTFETYTRNTLDLSAIPVVKKLSHLPVIVDPSHATGLRQKVPPMGLAAVAAGAHGLIVEVHPDPPKAISDGAQSLYPEQFEKLMRDIEALAPVVGRELARVPSEAVLDALGRRRSGKQGRAEGAADGGGPCPRAAFQGERGAYSEKALNRFFPEQEFEPIPVSGFRKVFNTVLAGDADFGIVPLENSLAGSVHENYDLLLQYPDLQIAGEIKIRIEHHLLGVPGAQLDDIRKVFSHPQGLAQCAEFIEEHGWEAVPFFDTAGSAAHVMEEGRKAWAAVASIEAAQYYGAAVLKEGIESNPGNYTRFAVLAREEKSSWEEKLRTEGADKASLVFQTKDKPGALAEALEILSRHGLNMTKLESRPIPGKPWNYMFYVDVRVPKNRSRLQEGFEELQKEAEDLRLLGLYRAV